MQKSSINISPEEIKKIVAEVDYADNGRINYTEFISATINTKRYLTEDRINAIFTSFDLDNTG